MHSSREAPIAQWMHWAKRKKNCKSWSALARKIGVSHSTISRWVNGSRVSVSPRHRWNVHTFLAKCISIKRKPLTPAEFESGPPKETR